MLKPNKRYVCKIKNAMKMKPLNSKGLELLQFLLQSEEITGFLFLCV